jgi:hypothetical protein
MPNPNHEDFELNECGSLQKGERIRRRQKEKKESQTELQICVRPFAQFTLFFNEFCNCSRQFRRRDYGSPPRTRRGGRDEVEDGVVRQAANCRSRATPTTPATVRDGPRHPLLVVEGGEPFAQDCPFKKKTCAVTEFFRLGNAKATME